MRIIEPEELKKLREEVDPYLIVSIKDGVSFKEGTPDEIKEKFERWKNEFLRLHG